MKRVKLFSKEAGDTIVEVLIATAVISAALGMAYAISNRSLRAGQQSQERVEALKLVEGQIEKLKYLARTDGAFDTVYRASDYCITQTTPPQKKAKTDALCTVNNRYALEIAYTGDVVNDPPRRLGNFLVKATWNRLGGGADELVINYQL